MASPTLSLRTTDLSLPRYVTRAGILGLLGIASNYTTPYHPQTNGQVERYNRTLVRQLRCYIAEHQTEWDSLLALLTTAYNIIRRCMRARGGSPLPS